MLADWGAFLDVNLYREALLHFTDGPVASARLINLHVDGRIVGTQHMCMLGAGSAWHISTVRGSLEAYRTHLIRLLRHTRLDIMQWINLDQRAVTFQTLTK